MTGYSSEQQVTLALIPKFSGTVGILSSIFIISEICRDYRNNEMNPIKRALLGVTCFEVMDSFGWWLSSWMIPESTDFAFASGGRPSCNFQGFLLQVAIGAPLNNGLMTYMFYRLVKEGHDVTKIIAFEWKAHLLIAVFAIGTGILLLELKQYNPTNQVCWINGYPSGCDESVLGGSDVPCERGKNAYLYGIFCFYVVLWCVIFAMTFMNISMRRFLLQVDSSEVQWVTNQALLYSFAFLVTWTPSTLWSILTWVNQGGFWLDVLSATFEPLQGFWNMLIFIRNRPESIERLRRIFKGKFFPSKLDRSGEVVPAPKSDRKLQEQAPPAITPLSSFEG